MVQLNTSVLAIFLLALSESVQAKPSEHLKRRNNKKWIPTWGSMPQLTEPANLPSAPFNTTNNVFLNSTIRQTIHTSLGGSQIRLQFSNVFGLSNLPITTVTLALPVNGSAGAKEIQIHTLRNVTFSGSESFIVPPGAVVVSDPVDLVVRPMENLAVTMYLKEGTGGGAVTGHPGSRTTSWWTNGNQVSATSLDGSTLASAAHWYFLTSVEISVPKSSKALIIIGDSITDGRGSSTDNNNRWPDLLLARTQESRTTSHISIINKAAGGNRILHDGLGPNALSRIDRDVLAQPGLAYAMIFEGVNDIGTAAIDTVSQRDIGDRLIGAYKQIALRLQAIDVPFFAATITPFCAPGYNVSMQSYSDPGREATRQRVNSFIRSSEIFDGVVDFDAVVRNETHPSQLAEVYDSGDYLHLNVLGYQKMADHFSLGIFA